MYRKHSGYLTTNDNTKLYYQDEGMGDVVIFLHGLGASLSCFDGIVKELLPYKRCIRYDQRGHGLSEGASDKDNIERLGMDLREVIRTLNLHRVAVVGHSLGGLAIFSYLDIFATNELRGIAILDMSPKPLCTDNWYAGLKNASNMFEPNIEFVTQNMMNMGKNLLQPWNFLNNNSGVFIPEANILTISLLWQEMLDVDYRDAMAMIHIPFIYFLPQSGLYPKETAVFLKNQVKGPFTLVEIATANHLTILSEHRTIANALRNL